VTGFLHPPDDLEGMAASAIALLRDPGLHQRVRQAAVARVRRDYCAERVVPIYEAAYSDVVAGEPVPPRG